MAYQKVGSKIVIPAKNADETPAVICNSFGIEEVYRDLFKNNFFAKMNVSVGNSDSTFIVPMSVVSSDKIFDPLTDHGLDLQKNKDNLEFIEEIIGSSEADAPRRYFHSHKGLSEVDGHLVFLGDEMIGHPTKESRYTNLVKDKDGTFEANSCFSSKGDFESWREGMLGFIKDNTSLQLSLVIGASSVPSAYYRKIGLLEGTLTIAFVGPSSGGKTTYAGAGSSVWSSPKIGEGVMGNLRATENHIIASLNNNHGVLTVLDETTASKNTCFDDLLYDVSAGVSKGRCDSQGNPIPRGSWSGTILFTSEVSIFSKTNGTSGLHARLAEINTTFAKSAQEAEDILEFITENYGTAWKPFVETFLSMPRIELRKMFVEKLSEVTEKIKPFSGVERRICKNYATLLVTAEVAKTAWQMPFDTNAILDLLVECYHEDLTLCDPATLLQERIMGIIAQYRSRFYKASKTAELWVPSTIWGTLEEDNKGNDVVWITAEAFKEIVKKLGMTSEKQVLDILASANLLKKSDERYKLRHNFGGIISRGYCLEMDLLMTKKEKEAGDKKTEKKKLMSKKKAEKKRKAEAKEIRERNQLMKLLDSMSEDEEEVDEVDTQLCDLPRGA